MRGTHLQARGVREGNLRFAGGTWVYHSLWYALYGVTGAVGRRNVIRGVGNSRLRIEVVRASTYTSYDIGKRYASTSAGRGLISITSTGTTSCRPNSHM